MSPAPAAGREVAVWLLDEMAERAIAQARERGELDDLPNAGRPLELDDDSMVPAELRAGYRLLKNAGYLPEELELRREIRDVEQLLREARSAEERAEIAPRLRLLLDRLGRSRSSTVMAQAHYFDLVWQRIESSPGATAKG